MHGESDRRRERQIAAPNSQADFAHTETRREGFESTGDAPIDEDARRRFEQARRAGSGDPLELYLPPPDDPYYLATLEELIHIELEWAWRGTGSIDSDKKTADRVVVEHFLAQFPHLHRDDIVLRLLRQEYFVRHKYGDLPSSDTYRERFPGLITTGHEIDPNWNPVSSAMRSSGRHFAAGQDVGRYRLTDSYAKGGFGVVWRADDNKLRRKVALKHLRDPLADDVELRRRFVAEARITAQLEHPGVVPVYDIGGLDDESPYYAMRFVRGRTLEEAIRTHHAGRTGSQPNPVDRLRLLNAFVTMAKTMQYAHAQGVLHRDLKPQNVVLGDFGETIILDWGLARRSSGDSVDSTAETGLRFSEPSSEQTAIGSVKGTPAYMAPEQAAGKTDDIDHRSDVYALGSILFHLLTGHLPFEGSSEEAVRTKALYPEAPSPRCIDARVPRPLDAICQKAMAPSKLDRYDSAGDLVRDIERHLADAPVDAWREPLFLRAGRFLRHHRTLMTSLLTSVAVLLVSLMVGIALLSASNQREHAAREVADQQREEAIEYYRLARDSVDRFLNTVTDDERLRAQSLEPLRRQLLESGLEFYEPLAAKRPNDQHLMADYASAQLRLSQLNRILGNYPKAVEAAERAVEQIDELNRLQPGTPFWHEKARAHLILAMAYGDSGHLAEATPQFEAAVNILRKVVKDDRSNIERQIELASALNGCGSHYFKLLRGQVDKTPTTVDLAKRARDLISEGIEIRERLLATHGDRPTAGKTSTLRSDLAGELRNLSSVLAIQEDYDAARKTALRSIQIRNALLERDPESQHLQAAIASSLTSLAVVDMRTGRFEDAIVQFERARDRSSQLAARHPDVLDFRYDIAAATMNIAECLRTLGRSAESAAQHEDAVEILKGLVEVSPDSLRFYRGIANSQRIRAFLLFVDNDHDGATAAYDEAIGAYRMIVEQQPKFLENLAQCELNAAGLHASRDEHATSDALARACLKDYELVVRQRPETTQDRANRAKAWLTIGQLYEKQDRTVEAEDAYREALDLLHSGRKKFPDTPSLAQDLATVEEAVASLRLRTTSTKSAVGTADDN